MKKIMPSFIKKGRIDWKNRRTWIIAALVLVALLIGFRVFSSGNDAAEEAERAPRSVRVASVAELMNGGTTISIVGTVESRSEATIRSESGGRVTRVNASLGQSVSAGSIIAEVENSSQRAAVMQAEGAYDAAKANLQKIEGGTRDEQLAILQAAADAARSGAVNALLSAYSSVDAAVKDSTDSLFSNAEGMNPQLSISTSDSQAKIDAQLQRSTLNALLGRQASQANAISVSSDLDAELARTETELRTVRSYLDTLIRVLNAGVAVAPYTETSLATSRASANAARTSINASLSGITSARSAIATAQKNLEQGVSGAQAEDIAAVQASVKQAEGAYNAALANLEKTRIRSPISGTLNNFTIKLGDALSPSQQVAIVSNNGALEIVAYVGDDERSQITAGSVVRIDDRFDGTVTRVAPAIDPVTRRAEVKIGLSSEASAGLSNGESVRVSIVRASGSDTGVDAESSIIIPITAIKLEADRTVVFSVDAEGRLNAIPIRTGPITGSRIQVLEGLTVATEIVADARGLKEGDTVSPQR